MTDALRGARARRAVPRWPLAVLLPTLLLLVTIPAAALAAIRRAEGHSLETLALARRDLRDVQRSLLAQLTAITRAPVTGAPSARRGWRGAREAERAAYDRLQSREGALPDPVRARLARLRDTLPAAAVLQPLLAPPPPDRRTLVPELRPVVEHYAGALALARSATEGVEELERAERARVTRLERVALGALIPLGVAAAAGAAGAVRLWRLAQRAGVPAPPGMRAARAD